MENNNSNNKKEYYNKDLEKILKTYITYKRYGNFAEVVEDIFQRRAYEFGFSESEVEAQVINFVKNIKKIKFASQKSFTHEDTAACYKGNKILINRDYFYRESSSSGAIYFGTSMYSALAHEVYHGAVYTKDGIGLTFYNENYEREGVALDEIFTETASYRTSFNRADELDSFTEGYTKITFAVNLLAAALGTTEKELLKSGITNRKELMKLFNSRFSNKEDAEFAENTYLKKFEESLNILYNVEYSFEGNETIEAELRKTALISLYESCYDLASYQISTDKINTSPKYVSEVIYRFMKLGTIVQDSMNRVIANEKPEDLLSVAEGIEGSIKGLADKVIAMHELSKNFNNFSDYGSYYEQFESIRKGMSDERRKVLSEKYGIEIPEDSVKTLNSMEIDSEYRDYVLREDFDNGKAWDNVRIAELMRDLYDSEIQRVGVINYQTEELEAVGKSGFFDRAIKAINILISKFKNRGVPQLQAPGAEEVYSKNVEISDFDRRYKVDINTETLGKGNLNRTEEYKATTNEKSNERED